MNTAFQVLHRLIPVEPHERRLFWTLAAILSALTYSHRLLKIVRDALVMTAPDSGAEIIPFLKTWALIPVSFLLIRLFQTLMAKNSLERTFQFMLGGFLAFFAIFLLILYPNADNLAPTALCRWLAYQLPNGLQPLLLVIRHWPLTLFYVSGEMWSTLLISLLFWTYSSGIVTLHQAVRFYVFFSLDFAGLAIGGVMGFYRLAIGDPTHSWNTALHFLVSTILLAGLLALTLMRSLSKTHPLKKTPPKIKNRPSVKTGLQHLLNAPYAALLGVGAFAYEFMDEILEFLWKVQLVERFPDPGAYTNFLSNISLIHSIAGTLTVFFLSGPVIRRCRWKTAGLVAPAVMVSSAAVFIGCLLLPSLTQNLAAIFGWTPIHTMVMIGAFPCVLSKVVKMTFFDNTKEIAFRAMSEVDRTQGKAFGDALASRTGKAGSVWLEQGLLLLKGNVTMAIPLFSAAVISMGTCWLAATAYVAREVEEKMDLKQL